MYCINVARAVADAHQSAGTNLVISWLMSEALDYLLSINATTNATRERCTAAAMATGAAAIDAAHDPIHGGFYELKTAAGSVSRAKVWWIQANAMLALWKLHQYYGGVSNSFAEGAVNDRQNYLAVLAGTTRFVRQYQTDNEVAGEQFWQVGLTPGGRVVVATCIEWCCRPPSTTLELLLLLFLGGGGSGGGDAINHASSDGDSQ
jgi:hypothetical protein